MGLKTLFQAKKFRAGFLRPFPFENKSVFTVRFRIAALRPIVPGQLNLLQKPPFESRWLWSNRYPRPLRKSIASTVAKMPKK